MRPPRPWFRSDRDAWYVQHEGKQVLLARGKANKAQAVAAFHKLMANGKAASSATEESPVATLCDLFLDFSEANHTADVFKNYRYILQVFCRQLGKFPANTIKPFHVNRWVDGKKTWNGSKRHAMAAVKRVYSWAEQQGLISSHPLRTLTLPRPNRRERIPSQEERSLILGSIKDTPFRQFLTAMQGTGCRPSKVARVTAADVNVDLGVWVLQRHKTAKKTGRPRVIYRSSPATSLAVARERVQEKRKTPTATQAFFGDLSCLHGQIRANGTTAVTTGVGRSRTRSARYTLCFHRLSIVHPLKRCSIRAIRSEN